MNRLWELLGIEPTKDIKEIRNAFKEKSKDVHPEEHPDEFRELKDAYKFAMEYAKSITVKEVVFIEDIREVFIDDTESEEAQQMEFEETENYLFKHTRYEEEETIISIDEEELQIEFEETENYLFKHTRYEEEETIISILINSGLNVVSLQLFLDEIKKYKFFILDSENQRVGIQAIIGFLEEIDFIHNENLSRDETILKEIYDKKIEKIILLYCNQLYMELQYSRIERPRKLIEEIESNSQYLAWVMPKFLKLYKLISKWNNSYLHEFSKYNFLKTYEYSLSNYNSEEDIDVRNKYYRIIMLYQLLEIDDKYKYDDLLYLLNVNEENHDILLLIYDYGKVLQTDKTYQSELEIIEKHMPFKLVQLQEMLDEMYYLYLPYEEYCDNNYLDLQMQIVREYALNKEIDSNYKAPSVVKLIFDQWARWESIQDTQKLLGSFEYYMLINDLIEATWDVIKSDLTYMVTREKYPEGIAQADELLDLMKKHRDMKSDQDYSISEMIDNGSLLIPKLLSVYILITSLQRKEIFAKGMQRFQLLCDERLITDNNIRMCQTNVLCPVTLIVDEEYHKFKKQRDQISWYDDASISSKSKSARKEINKIHFGNITKIGVAAFIGFVLMLVRSNYMQSIGSPMKSNNSPLINQEVMKEVQKEQKVKDKKQNEVEAFANNAMFNNNLTQIKDYKDFVTESNDPEKVADGSVNTTILKNLKYSEEDIKKFKEDLKSGNVEETEAILAHVNDSREDKVNRATIALNFLLGKNDYELLSEENRTIFNISEERYYEIVQSSKNGYSNIAREMIEEYLDGY